MYLHFLEFFTIFTLLFQDPSLKPLQNNRLKPSLMDSQHLNLSHHIPNSHIS